MSASGQCLCGAVRFTAAKLGGFGICHCGQCNRWLGGPMLGVTVEQADMSVAEGAPIVTRRTSGWASRSRCAECGSPLWYRFDKGVDGAGNYEVPLGILDDANGLALTREIFIDRKPDSYSFAGAHERLTEDETLALYAPSSEGA
ncbi:GFA family protein [Maritalea mobilis]|uniref:GFA family protein n=1 Tax=Maritalea mobilis TaxID=483324 RepID=UPI001C93CC43|nr:GFA family protein [Maritalea mobilis]MBY6201525.1 GFA family protein [Maritalea mobilis]